MGSYQRNNYMIEITYTQEKIGHMINSSKGTFRFCEVVTTKIRVGEIEYRWSVEGW
jgi:hypothetical protein